MLQPAFYPTSGWRTILAARDDFAALERLMARYRPPILLEMQSRVRCDRAQAEDLTQEFIRVWLRRDFLKNIDPRKGRFRSFIKACVVRFLIDRHRHKASEPELSSLDATNDQGQRITDPPSEALSPEISIDLAWARQVLVLALAHLEQDCINARRGVLFTRLHPFLDGDPQGDSYAAAAIDLGMNEPALRTAVHRMRKRLGELIKEEIKENVGPDEDWQEELRYFLDLLGRHSTVT